MAGPRPFLTAKHYAWITAAFTLFVVYGSLVPLTMRHLDWDQAVDRFGRAMSRGVRLESRSDWAANVILFVPLGFVAAGAVAVDRKRPFAAMATIPAMTALSAGLEFAQLWFPDRNTSVNDVAAETLGGILGVAAWLLFGQTATNRARAAWARLGPGDWAVKALPAYLFFLVIVHGMPFDLTLSPWQIKKKYDRGREIDAESSGVSTIGVAPWPRQLPEKTLLNIAYFLPVGALIAFLPDRRWRRPESATKVATLGFLMAGGIEAVQLIVISAGTYASDVLCGGLVVLGGWWLAIRPRPLSSTAWATAAVAWAIALMLVFWAPLEFAPESFAERFSRSQWMPFADYYAGNYIAAFNRIINKTVLFAPLGFAACRAFRLTPRGGAGTGALISAVIELGQPFFNDHLCSSSDILLGGVGACIGAYIAGRAKSAEMASGAS
jgi:glycopeptide antibiotics resistance protein